MSINIQYRTVHNGYDRETCWVQTRAGYVPDADKAVITTQKLRLSGSDIFYAINSMHSEDGGRNWSSLVEQPGFARRNYENGTYFYVSDFWPKWHCKSGTMLGTGHTPLYKDDELCTGQYRRTPAYSIYDSEKGLWNQWQYVKLPDEPRFFNCGAGSTQRVDLPDGDILLPIYGYAGKGAGHRIPKLLTAVIRLSFDGQRLIYQSHGNFLTLEVSRGLYEPSLAVMDGRYFLTVRNDEKGYLAVSNDGLNFSEPIPWTFDDKQDIGNYNTQQHWLTLNKQLFLVYTRKGVNNDHVFRHRAPLMIARFDPQNLCLIRETEQIAVPEHGARLGNFGITEIADDRAWVVVSEWMQGLKGIHDDLRELEGYGSNNSFFISEITSG